MSGDLILLHLLVVSGHLPFRDIWRDGARMATIPLEFVDTDAPLAVARLSMGGIDIVVIDDAQAAVERDSVILAARQAKPSPFVMVAAVEKSTPISGADCVVERTTDLNQVRASIAAGIRARIPIRVLVVDDSGTMRSIVKKVLTASKYVMEVVDAPEGEAALHEIRRGFFDLVILDYNMPGLNGIETLRQIKRGTPNVAVVLMTSNVDEVLARRAIAAGAIGFLKKPFYPADIDSALDSYFESRKSATLLR